MPRLALLTAVLSLVATAPAAAQTATPTPTPTPTPTATPKGEERIASGISAGGVDLSGLTEDEAASKLRRDLGARVRRALVVKSAGKKFELAPTRRLDYKLDADSTAKRAMIKSRELRKQQGGEPPAGAAGSGIDVGLIVTYSSTKLRAWVNEIDAAVSRAPKNATLRMTLTEMFKRRAKHGLDLDANGLYATLKQVLADPVRNHQVIPKLKRIPAPINANDLVRQYPTVVTIDRAGFKLRLFKGLKHSKTYGIAVGAPGYPTPTGRFSITNKAVNPVWTAPNSPWAGEFAGQSVPGGSASNPLKARWLGIVNGVGIHGTGAEYSIGTRASHGCIRMRVADVIDLYPRVPIGTPVLIR